MKSQATKILLRVVKHLEIEQESIIDSIINMDKCQKSVEYLQHVNVGQNEDTDIKALIDQEISNLINEYSSEFNKLKEYAEKELEEKRILDSLSNISTAEINRSSKNNTEIESIKIIDCLLDDINTMASIMADSSGNISHTFNELVLEMKNVQKIKENTYPIMTIDKNQLKPSARIGNRQLINTLDEF
jgi:hypothetical protein